MKIFNHYIQHLITQHTSLGALISKALHSNQTKSLVIRALSSKLHALITDVYVENGIVTFLCSTAEKATLVRFDSIDLLSVLRQDSTLGHIKKIQVRVVPTYLQPQNNYFTTRNDSRALESTIESRIENKSQNNKISRETSEQLLLLANSLNNEPGSQELKASLEKLAKHAT